MRATSAAFTVLAFVVCCSAATFPSNDELEQISPEQLAAYISAGFENSIDDKIRKMLESLRENMTQPMPSLGLPTLDPLSIEHFGFNLTEPAAMLDGFVDDVHVNNLSTFVVDLVKTNLLLLKAEFGVTLPDLDVDGTYLMEGTVGEMIPVFGNGTFSVRIQNLSVDCAIKIGSKNGSVFLKNLTIDFNLGGLNVHFDGLMGGGDLSDLINQVINDLVPELISENKHMIESVVAEVALGVVNEKLDGITLQEILDWINGKK